MPETNYAPDPRGNNLTVASRTFGRTGGASFNSGTITSSSPGLTITQNWNNVAVTFAAMLIDITDSASASASRYISVKRNASDMFVVDNIGRLQIFFAIASDSGGSVTLFKRGAVGDANAVPAADSTLGLFGCRGWNGTAYHTDPTGMQILAEQQFSGVNGGTRIEFRLVPNGSASNGAALTLRSASLNMASGVALLSNLVQVVSSRRTGWTAATGTPTRTAFDTATVTLPLLAERVKALLDDLIAHGLIGA